MTDSNEREIIACTTDYVMNTYKRFPISLRKGRGITVWSTDDGKYLDFVGGIATNVLGHCHPKVVVAIQKQAQRLMHVSNLYHIEPQARLARMLVQHSFSDKVFFCNSGAEANEAAIKLARKYAKQQHGSEKFEIITAYQSFHGRTLATLAATGQKKLHKGFEPLPAGFSYAAFDDPAAIKDAITEHTCAVMLEPLQGEAGIRVASEDYLREVRRICDEHDLLLILDEVQTGMGRTGTLFAYEQAGIEPDIMSLAKGLGAGMPIGAMLATDAVASAFGPGDHGSTFGGNPLACAAGLATLETLLEGGFLLDQCRRMSTYMIDKLHTIKNSMPDTVKEVRGRGLLVGMELNHDCADVVTECMEHGLLINCADGTVLRFMPPLIVEQDDIDKMADIVESALKRLF